MALEDIVRKIDADARAAADALLEEGKREAESILAAARERARTERERLDAAARQRADEERNRIVTLARLSARRDLLSGKQQMIDRVFDEVRRRLATMPEDEYRLFIKGVMKSSVETGSEDVVIGEDESRIDQAFLDEVSREIGGGAKLTLSSERRRMDGGCILKRGKTETNCTLETILRSAREQHETEVAAILFGAETKRES
jgi:V/A-type H+/Na+-transporting ATPase subunit E